MHVIQVKTKRIPVKSPTVPALSATMSNCLEKEHCIAPLETVPALPTTSLVDTQSQHWLGLLEYFGFIRLDR